MIYFGFLFSYLICCFLLVSIFLFLFGQRFPETPLRLGPILTQQHVLGTSLWWGHMMVTIAQGGGFHLDFFFFFLIIFPQKVHQATLFSACCFFFCPDLWPLTSLVAHVTEKYWSVDNCFNSSAGIIEYIYVYYQMKGQWIIVHE